MFRSNSHKYFLELFASTSLSIGLAHYSLSRERVPNFSEKNKIEMKRFSLGQGKNIILRLFKK